MINEWYIKCNCRVWNHCSWPLNLFSSTSQSFRVNVEPAKREPERFGDSTLTQKFIWKKKNEYLQAAGRLPVQWCVLFGVWVAGSAEITCPFSNLWIQRLSMFQSVCCEAFTGQPAKIKKLQRCKARFVRSNRRRILIPRPNFGSRLAFILTYSPEN